MPPLAVRNHVRNGELLLNVDNPVYLGEIFCYASYTGREVLFRILLRSLSTATVGWPTRMAAQEFFSWQLYQPAIPVLIRVALEEWHSWTSIIALTLGNLRADQELIRIVCGPAREHMSTSRKAFLLGNLFWSPTGRSLDAMVYGGVNRGMWIGMSQLRDFGVKIMDDPRPELIVRVKELMSDSPPLDDLPSELMPKGLSPQAIWAWETGFDPVRALERGPICPLELGEGIVEARNALLLSRQELDPVEQIDQIISIDRIFGRVITGLNRLRQLGEKLVR